MPRWIVELEHGVFLAPIDGDPGRTLVPENATVFASHPRARLALLRAQKVRPFAAARVTLAPTKPNVRAKRATTAGRAGQQAQNGAKPQRLMAGVACRWRSA